MPTFMEVYDLLIKKGPGKAASCRGTEYRIEVGDNCIFAFPKSGMIKIHEDCWGDNITCKDTRAGGIYNGPYSIFNWYRDNI